MTRPSLWAALVLPSLAITSVGAAVAFASGHPVIGAVLAGFAIMPALVVRHTWRWNPPAWGERR